MLEINGKVYPMWNQFVANKSKWIGGILQDLYRELYSGEGMGILETIITDVELKPNGENSAYFSVVGKDFSCGFDVKFGDISSRSDKGWITFIGFMGHEWRIKERKV